MQIYQLNIRKYDQLLNLYTYMHISHFHFPKHLSVSSRNVMSRSVDILSDALPEQKPKLSFLVKLFDLQFQPIFLFPMHIQQYYTKNNNFQESFITHLQVKTSGSFLTKKQSKRLTTNFFIFIWAIITFHTWLTKPILFSTLSISTKETLGTWSPNIWMKQDNGLDS